MEQADSCAPTKTLSALKARQNFGQMLEEVYYRDEQFIIERAGKPMAAVIPLWQLEEWQKLHDQPKKSPAIITGRTRRRKQDEL